MHPIDMTARRVRAIVCAALLGAAIPGAAIPGAAIPGAGFSGGSALAAIDEPALRTETSGAFHASASAFATLPPAPRIEVRLTDDSPENLDLRALVQGELRTRGHAAEGGERLVLTIETEVSILVGGREVGRTPPADADKGELDVLGFLRAVLDDPRTGERLWAAEAAYRRSDGDLPAGARSMVPLLVEQIGRSVELNSVRVR